MRSKYEKIGARLESLFSDLVIGKNRICGFKTIAADTRGNADYALYLKDKTVIYLEDRPEKRFEINPTGYIGNIVEEGAPWNTKKAESSVTIDAATEVKSLNAEIPSVRLTTRSVSGRKRMKIRGTGGASVKRVTHSEKGESV